jgi:hypothetical protein
MDRIKAHRSAPTVYDPPTFDQMANHITQLEESNKELTMQLLATSGQAADALDKLSKAVEIGNKMAASIKGNYYIPNVVAEWNTVLAELEKQ